MSFIDLEIVNKSNIIELEVVEKFNPYHDRLGRFTFANQATSFTIASNQYGMKNSLARAKEKEKQRTTAFSLAGNNIDTFTAGMTPMQKKNALNTLEKKRRYTIDGKETVMSDKEFCEKAVSEGRNLTRITTANASVSGLLNEGKPKQFDYLVKHEKIRQNQYVDFVKGNLDNPVAKYFSSKDATVLPGKYKKTEYVVGTDKNNDRIGVSATKTMVDYIEHLSHGGNYFPTNKGNEVFIPNTDIPF